MKDAVSSLPRDATSPPARPPLSREELRDVLTTVLRAGQLMLENGANTARVEQTIHQLGTALGAEWLDAYVTPQGVIATVVSHHEHRTRIQRITKSGVDLSRVAAVFELAKQTERGELTTTEACAELERIGRQPRLYGVWTTTLAVALACAAFAVLFGGGLWEFIVVFLAAGAGQYLRHVLLHRNVDRLLTTALVAVCASSLALSFTIWLVRLGLFDVQATTTVAASVLLLVPGVLLVSGTADLFRGDVLPGIARAMAAFLFVLAIAVGIWAVLLITRVPIDIHPAAQSNLLLALVMASFAAGGFAVLFDVPRQYLLFAALVGMLAVGVRFGVLAVGLPVEVGSFCAGLTIGVLAEVLGRRLHTLTSLFAIPGYIPLVPGVPAFRAVLNFVNQDYLAGVADFVRAMLIVVAIAVGLGTVNAVMRVRQRPLF